MFNFHELQTKKIICSKTFMRSWEKELDIEDSQGLLNKKKLSQIKTHTHNIWKMFNKERDQFDKHYMDSANFIIGYLSSFFIPNIQRTFSILFNEKLKNHVEKTFSQNNNEICIVDFGSGPLSATIGFLFFLEDLFEKNKNLILPQNIKIYAVERNLRIFDKGVNLLKSCLQNTNITIEHATSVIKVPQNFDFVFCSNVFNEIPQKHRLKTLNSIYDKLNDNALTLIIEPGQEEHSKHLSDLRDEFLAQNKTTSILYPCLHKKECPMSSISGRKDWCWFRNDWIPPEIQQRVDIETKINHSSLNFSSFVFTNVAQVNESKDGKSGRIVSDLIKIPQPTPTQKYLICKKSGLIESVYIDENDEYPKRGDLE